MRYERLIMSVIITMLVSFSAAGDSAPDFDYGFGESHFKWGTEVPMTNKESDFKLRLGTRLQSIIEDSSAKNGAGETTHNQDFYIRRARLQVEAKFQDNLSYYMDIRADKIDKGNSKSGGFALGDAFFQIKKIFNNENLKLRLFRAKYDVSRSQTISSSRLLLPNRTPISDFASEYISEARRGSNIQLLGNWSNQIKTQLVLGDGVKESSFKDSISKSTATLNTQNFAMGARVRISPFAEWTEKGLKETHFGHGKHFTVGAGHYRVDNVGFEASGRVAEVDRSLNNFDLSFHYGAFSLTGEFFSFEGVIDDYSTAAFAEGKSDGWYAQSEYVFTNFHYIAPYIRYQYWDHFSDNADFAEKSSLVGVNYYMKGNKLRTGMYYDTTEYETALASAASLDDKVTKIGMYLMMHY